MDAHLDENLRTALEDVESCLATPLVPGELERWVDALGNALDALEPRLRERIDDAHADQFETILREDRGLQARVDHLREADAANLDRFDALRERVRVLQRHVAEIEPDEKRLRDTIDSLVEEGAIFLFRVRRNETAITTWLLEAFDRDRGEVD